MSNEQNVWKYSYWFDDEHLELLKQQMQGQGIDMVCAQYSPCAVMADVAQQDQYYLVMLHRNAEIK